MIHHTVLQQAYEAKTTVVLLQKPYYPKSKEGFYTINHPAFYTITPTLTLQNNLQLRVIAYFWKNTLKFTPRYDLANDPNFQVIKVFSPETFHILNVYNDKERLVILPN